MKRVSKGFLRLLAGAMTLSVCLSTAVLAADPLNQGQITKDSLTPLTEETAENGLLTVNKSVMGTDMENEFQIQLDVTTSEKLEEMKIVEGNAAVMIIVDKSSSMNDFSPILLDEEELETVRAEWESRILDLQSDEEELPPPAPKKDGADEEPVDGDGDPEEENENEPSQDGNLEEGNGSETPDLEGTTGGSAGNDENSSNGETEESGSQTTPSGGSKPAETETPDGGSSGEETPSEGASGELSAVLLLNSANDGAEDGLTLDLDLFEKLPKITQSEKVSSGGGNGMNVCALPDVDAVLEEYDGIPDELKQAIYDCYHRRSWFERKAVLDFLESYQAADVHRYFALGTFDQAASVKIDWQDASRGLDPEGAAKAATYGASNKDIELWTSDNAASRKAVSNTIYTNGKGTNIAGAYLLARNMMYVGFDPEVGCYRNAGVPQENLRVIIVTDGDATACPDQYEELMENPLYKFKDVVYGEDGGITSYDLEDNAKISGNYPDDSAMQIAETVAVSLIENAGFRLTAVQYGYGTSGNSILENAGTYHEKVFVADESISSLGMSQAFTEVIPPVFTKPIPWTVADPMGQYIVYDGLADEWSQENNRVTFDQANSQLTWVLTESKYAEEIQPEPAEGALPQYHYRLNYRVRLDNTQSGFVPEQSYAANGETVLRYVVKEETDGTAAFSEERTLEFDVPEIQGYLSDVALRKTSVSGASLAGAEFTLTGTSGLVEGRTWTAVSDGNGNVIFAGIPSGFIYKLAETAAPAGYIRSDDTYDVAVSYGQTSILSDGQPVQGLLTVVNTPSGGTGGGPGPDPSPDPGTNIPEEDVPLTELPEEDVPLAENPDVPVLPEEIPDEEVPLAEAPRTGDLSVWALVLAGLSGAGLAVLWFQKKREEA